MFISVKVSNLILFSNLIWKRNCRETENALSQEICSDSCSGKWSQVLSHSSHWEVGSFSPWPWTWAGLWLFWPIEYNGGDAVLVLGLTCRVLVISTSSLLESSHHAARKLKQLQSKVKKKENWSPANSHNWTSSQHPASTLLPRWVRHPEVTPPAPVDTGCHKDKLPPRWVLPTLPKLWSNTWVFLL